MSNEIKLGNFELTKDPEIQKFLANPVEPVNMGTKEFVFPKTGEKRRITFEFHPRDDAWAGDTARKFIDNYVKRYNRYLSGDDHKMDINMSIPDDIYGFCYTLAKDADTGAVVGFYAKRISPAKYKGRDAVACDGHSMFSSPGLGSNLKTEIEIKGDDDNHFVLKAKIKPGDEDMINATPLGMGGRGAKEVETNAGLGTVLSLIDWNNAIKYYDHPMLYSLDVANEASGYILTHKFDEKPFEGKNWKELSWRTNKKGQRCMIRIERLFHPENW